MRTTLTLDPDVAQALKARIAEKNTTLKQVVNQALRRGLAAEPAKKKKPFRVIPHSSGFQPGIDVTKLGQLADELEVEAFIEQQARNRRA
jgi:hypothetical protein